MSRRSSIFGQVGRQTIESSALERLKTTLIDL